MTVRWSRHVFIAADPCIRDAARTEESRRGLPFLHEDRRRRDPSHRRWNCDGDTVQIQGPSTNLEQTVDALQIEHAVVSRAGPGQEVGMKVRDRVREKDFVYKLIPMEGPVRPPAAKAAAKAPAKKAKAPAKKARAKKAPRKKAPVRRKASRAPRSRGRRASRRSRSRSR